MRSEITKNALNRSLSFGKAVMMSFSCRGLHAGHCKIYGGDRYIFKVHSINNSCPIHISIQICVNLPCPTTLKNHFRAKNLQVDKKVFPGTVDEFNLMKVSSMEILLVTEEVCKTRGPRAPLRVDC